MRLKLYILLLISFYLGLVPVPDVRADSETNKEYQVKAAFLYNFIKFIDWPNEQGADVNRPITIGIIGNENFIKAFEPVRDEKIKGRDVLIKYFADYENLKTSNGANNSQLDKKIEPLKVCNVLMFCGCDSTDMENPNRILKALKGLPILTVGETERFLESGGVINFLMEDKKVGFEVNATTAKTSKLKMSSTLLRLAKRVIEEEPQ